jgi:hypothetical protein
MISLYDDGDRAYLEWLHAYPDGFVISMYRNKSPDYMVLHKASCRLISSYNQMAKRGGFTERRYIKGCAITLADAQKWVSTNGRPDGSFSKQCVKCIPSDKLVIIDAKEDDDLLQEEVRKSRLLTREERQRRLERAPKIPELIQSTCGTFRRNPDVVVEVLLRANGHCEMCRRPAPFIRARDNSPYLEVHHLKRLKDGGEDTIDNAIALCPNCHREEHCGIEIKV